MKKWKVFRYKGILLIMSVFLLIGLVLFAERSGIRYEMKNPAENLLAREESIPTKKALENLKTDCLVLSDSTRQDSMMALAQFQQIFKDMKVGYQNIDVTKEAVPAFEDYETVVVLMSDLNPLEENIIKIADWVEEGGNALFAMTIEKDLRVSTIEQKMGIVAAGYEHAVVDSIYLSEAFMLGGGAAYNILEPYDSAWAIQLNEDAIVHAWTGDEKKVPLVWEYRYGKGKFVIDNLGIYEKVTRGIYAASYSLLTDVGVYPVINGSSFYLDDFPSPVPSGNGFYVYRDYGMNIEDFYTNVWWPDMLKLAEEHGVKYTGVIIENYDDKTDGVTVTTEDAARFQYFGKMLLKQGGELGYHGYNHQPLCLDNVEYGNVLPYNVWESTEAMSNAMKELETFGEREFPNAEKAVYVPPSNVLSEEGRTLLSEEFPQIRTIASNFFEGEMAYAQEFEVAEDGIVEQPRIISGAVINDYMEMAAMSELNMHFVNNHFIHPDDLLDEDRGATLGWEKLKTRLDEYMDWLYTSAPSLRNFTGSELSAAIQRFAAVTVEKEITDEEVVFHLGNFFDEAWLMVRFNEGTPGTAEGGSLEHLTGNLYLLKAEESEVKIKLDR